MPSPAVEPRVASTVRSTLEPLDASTRVVQSWVAPTVSQLSVEPRVASIVRCTIEPLDASTSTVPLLATVALPLSAEDPRVASTVRSTLEPCAAPPVLRSMDPSSASLSSGCLSMSLSPTPRLVTVDVHPTRSRFIRSWTSASTPEPMPSALATAIAAMPVTPTTSDARDGGIRVPAPSRRFYTLRRTGVPPLPSSADGCELVVSVLMQPTVTESGSRIPRDSRPVEVLSRASACMSGPTASSSSMESPTSIEDEPLPQNKQGLCPREPTCDPDASAQVPGGSESHDLMDSTTTSSITPTPTTDSLRSALVDPPSARPCDVQMGEWFSSNRDLGINLDVSASESNCSHNQTSERHLVNLGKSTDAKTTSSSGAVAARPLSTRPPPEGTSLGDLPCASVAHRWLERGLMRKLASIHPTCVPDIPPCQIRSRLNTPLNVMSVICRHCLQEFPSRTKLFRHLVAQGTLERFDSIRTRTPNQDPFLPSDYPCLFSNGPRMVTPDVTYPIDNVEAISLQIEDLSISPLSTMPSCVDRLTPIPTPHILHDGPLVIPQSESLMATSIPVTAVSLDPVPVFQATSQGVFDFTPTYPPRSPPSTVSALTTRISFDVDNTQDTLALVDTGAAISLISVDILERLHMAWPQVYAACMPPPNVRLRMADRSHVQPEAYVRIPFYINGHFILHPFFVLPTVGTDVILGCDFLQRQRALIDFDTGTMHLRRVNTHVPVHHLEMGKIVSYPLSTFAVDGIITASRPHRLYAAQSVQLPPRMSVNIDLRFGQRSTLTGTVQNGLVSALRFATPKAWRIPYSYVDFTPDGLCSVRIDNATDAPIVISEGDHVAIFEETATAPVTGPTLHDLDPHTEGPNYAEALYPHVNNLLLHMASIPRSVPSPITTLLVQATGIVDAHAPQLPMDDPIRILGETALASLRSLSFVPTDHQSEHATHLLAELHPLWKNAQTHLTRIRDGVLKVGGSLPPISNVASPLASAMSASQGSSNSMVIQPGAILPLDTTASSTFPDAHDLHSILEPLIAPISPEEEKRLPALPAILNLPGSMSEAQQQAARNLIRRHAELFDERPNTTSVVTHHIETGSSPPVSVPPYRAGPSERAVIDAFIDELLKNGQIRPSSSPWAAPLLMVPKKDGSTRLCVDLRRLNAVTTRDQYPLPRTDDALDALGTAKWFTTMDLTSGYWQVALDEASRSKSAFTSHRGLYEWNVMPMGLTNAPATFQRMMDLVLAGYKWQFCLVYLDDIIVFSPTWERHAYDLHRVLQRLSTARLRIKAKKCFFFANEVQYLGFVVSSEGTSADPAKVKAMSEFPTPTNPSAVRSFLSLTGYYRRFVQSYARVSAPLRQLIRKDQAWQWSDAEQLSFDQLRQLISKAPLLRRPDFRYPFILQTDACKDGLGAVLSQTLPNLGEVPILFISRSTAPVSDEQKWGATDLEALAVVWACETLRPYLIGHCFRLETDHDSLRWLLNHSKTGRLARWAVRLQEYDYQIVHRKGITNQNADAFSRNPLPDMTSKDAFDRADCHSYAQPRNIPLPAPSTVDPALPQPVPMDLSPSTSLPVAAIDPTLTYVYPRHGHIRTRTGRRRLPPIVKTYPDPHFQALQMQQEADSFCGPLIRYLKGELTELTAEDRQHLHRLSSAYKLKDGILYTNFSSKWSGPVPLVPKGMRDQILSQMHDAPMPGHLGVGRTLQAIRSRFYWPSILPDVRRWVQSCLPCRQAKDTKPNRAGLLEPITSTYPMELVHIDIVGPCPLTKEGYHHILTIVDAFSGWPAAYPLRSLTATTVADLLFHHFTQYGLPDKIMSDLGFTSKVLRILCERLGVARIFTTPYHPRSNGKVERFHRYLNTGLRIYVNTYQNDWDQYLDPILFAYRMSEHSVTKISPYQILYGRPGKVPIDLIYRMGSTPASPPYNGNDWVDRLRDIFDRVTDARQHAAELQKQRFDASRESVVYSPGESVLIWSEAGRGSHVGTVRRLTQHWSGPYVVMHVSPLSANVYEVHDPTTGRRHKVSVQNMRRYHPRILTDYPSIELQPIPIPPHPVIPAPTPTELPSPIVPPIIEWKNLIKGQALVFFMYNGLSKRNEWYVGRVDEIHPDTGVIELQAYGFQSYVDEKRGGTRLDLAQRQYKPMWVDNRSHKEACRAQKKAWEHLETIHVSPSQLLYGPFHLLPRGHLPSDVVQFIERMPLLPTVDSASTE